MMNLTRSFTRTVALILTATAIGGGWMTYHSFHEAYFVRLPIGLFDGWVGLVTANGVIYVSWSNGPYNPSGFVEVERIDDPSGVVLADAPKQAVKKWYGFGAGSYGFADYWASSPVLVAAGMLAFIIFIPLPIYARFRRHQRKKQGVCVRCGYDLRASADSCPECGLEISAES